MAVQLAKQAGPGSSSTGSADKVATSRPWGRCGDPAGRPRISTSAGPPRPEGIHVCFEAWGRHAGCRPQPGGARGASCCAASSSSTAAAAGPAGPRPLRVIHKRILMQGLLVSTSWQRYGSSWPRAIPAFETETPSDETSRWHTTSLYRTVPEPQPGKMLVNSQSRGLFRLFNR